MNDNFIAIQQALDLSNDELKQLAIHSFEASFISDDEKTEMDCRSKKDLKKKPLMKRFLHIKIYLGWRNIPIRHYLYQ